MWTPCKFCTCLFSWVATQLTPKEQLRQQQEPIRNQSTRLSLNISKPQHATTTTNCLDRIFVQGHSPPPQKKYGIGMSSSRQLSPRYFLETKHLKRDVTCILRLLSLIFIFLIHPMLLVFVGQSHFSDPKKSTSLAETISF